MDELADDRTWARLLRRTCTILSAAPEGLTGISLTHRLDGDPEQVRRLLTLGKRYAEEYGLEVLPVLRGAALTFRFRRPVLVSQAGARRS